MAALRHALAGGSLLLVATAALAGGPRAVNGLGQPMAWDTAGPVVYNPDPGPLGLLTNAQARALLAQAFAEWSAGAADIDFSEGALLGTDVNGAGIPFTNPAHYGHFYRVDGDGRSPVIFDHDGSIIDAIFGSGARFEVLGVAGLDTPIAVDTEIDGASIVINGAFYDGVGLPDSPEDVSLLGLQAAMVHEIGHFINLDHSVVNDELALDGNVGNDVYVPTMFPALVDGEDALATTNPDDELAAANLYPPGAPANSISGSVKVGSVPFQGANVVLRKTDDPLMTAYSLISGGRFFPCNPGSTCDPCDPIPCNPGNPPEQGAFAADHFAPGNYHVCVQQIDTRFALGNGTFIGPLATPPIMPGPEDCYDSSEGGTSADDPDNDTIVSTGTGPVADIVLNALPGSDPFEPNNTFATASTLADLPEDTAPGLLGAGDIDVFNVPVTAGQRVRIELDAAELGSTLDAVVGFYDAANPLVPVMLVDDAVDPDSAAFSFDPAIELIAWFNGMGKVVVSAFPDLDQDGSGGGSTGGYWIHVEVATDVDGDGVFGDADVCPAMAVDDLDLDGVCFGDDNCPTDSNPTQDAPFKISGPLVANRDVTWFDMAPDDSTVVFIADRDFDEVFELYSVPRDGSAAPVEINASIATSPRDVTNLLISPDSTRVVYLADHPTNDVFELYSVPIGGGTVTKLNGTIVLGGDVLEFNISPDGASVVYRADQVTDEVGELFSVPIAGGTAVKLNGTLIAGGDIEAPGAGFSSFLITQNGQTVVYKADQDTDDVFELYSVPIGGGTPVKLNSVLVAGGDTGNFQLASSAGRLVYSADQETDGVFEIYSVPIAGGAVTKLNDTLPPGAVGWQRFRIEADQSTVVYTMDQETATVFELYSVPIAGGTKTKLSASLVSGGDVVAFTLPVRPEDGVRLAYRADQEVDERFELYSVPVDGGTVTKLNPALVSGGDVQGLFSILESRVLYHADQEVDEQLEAYSVAASGGTPVKFTGTMVANGDFQGLLFDPDRIIFIADREEDEVVELFGVRLGGGLPVQLNGALVAGGDVSNLAELTTDREPGAVVYVADQDTDEKFELYSRTLSLDTDADGVFDRCDICVEDTDASQADTDGNGVGDACAGCALGTDPDADAICGAADNCPTVTNAGQADFDGDDAGDACDADDDNDGLADVVETDTGTFVDGSDTGTDPFDADTDGDGLSDGDEVDAGSNPVVPASRPLRVPFGPQQTISNSADSAAAVFAADLDSDGDIDVLSASGADDKIAWYENDGASPLGWALHTISTSAGGAQSVFAADLDRDGDMDALSAAYDADEIAWYENTDGAGTFGLEQVIATGNDPRSVVATDVDGDGDADVLFAFQSGNTIAWSENTDGAGSFGPQQVISAAVLGPIRVVADDVDGDGDPDVLAASQADNTIAWYENTDGTGSFGAEQVISTTANDTHSVFAADLDGDGDVDVLSVSGVDDTVAWYVNTDGEGDFGPEQVISNAADGARFVSVADLDRDGDVDVLSASAGDDEIAWYENTDGAGSFGPPQVVSIANDPQCIISADLDSDGDPDLLSASAGDDTIAWYENRVIHRNAAFPSESIVGTMGSYADSVHLEDLDGDGDVDVVSGALWTRWYENLDGSGTSWSSSIVQSVSDGTGGTAVADLDRDGDLDVLSIDGTTGDLSWAENTAGDGSAWSVHAIPHVGGEGVSVNVADIDADGDLDVVTTMLSGRLSWHENTAGDASAWTEHEIQSHVFNWDNLPIDLDRDGDMDVVNTAGSGAIWYENTSGDGSTWSAPQGIGSLGGNYRFLAAGDLDGDGDSDVLLGSAALDTIEWYENSSADGSTWIEHTLTTSADEATSMTVGDLDADGDLDVVSAAAFSDQVVLHENVAGDGSVWSARVVSLLADSPRAVAVRDVDGDGRTDVAAISFEDDEVAWYENRGGQFTLATTTVAPATIADGSTTALLAIELTSNERAGGGEIELASIELLVTDGSGAVLSSDEANSLVERLTIHLDDGSTAFEPGIDSLVTSVETLALSPQAVEFEQGDARVRVSPGASKTLFIVAETAAGASSYDPSSFRLTHLTESSPVARDVETGALLEMEFAANTGTGSIQAVPDTTPPVVLGMFPAAGQVDVAPSTDVVLFMSEPVDASTAALGGTVSAGGVKVPGTTTVSPDGTIVGFDPESALVVDQDYVVEVTAALRDRAGNPAIPFSAIFDTTNDPGEGDFEADEFGVTEGGRTIEGGSENDNAGFATAALGDVNGTLVSHGIADLIVGAPKAGMGDEGRALLVFGGPGLQSNAGAMTTLAYETGTAGEGIGEAVARAGDLDGDSIMDFLIAAPHSDRSFDEAGTVFLVFGDPGLVGAVGPLDLDGLAACTVPTLCGVEFRGAAADELAGSAISYAGDVNGDGAADIVIGAPGASPEGKLEAGRAYLVYGPLAPAVVQLANVGGSVPGLVFHGESAGDRLGAAVSHWEDRGGGDGIDDLLLSAPGATALDEFGAPIADAGYVYAIQGGTGPGKLDYGLTPGVIDLGRVAGGGTDQVAGMVFVGAQSDGNLGRSLTGAVDTNGDGIDDVLMAGNGFTFLIPGDDPKRVIGNTQTGGNTEPELSRTLGGFDALADLGAIRYSTGDDDPLTVGPAGDVDFDGAGDFIIGAPLADGTAGVDSGKAYLVLGSPAPASGEKSLDDVGDTIAGFIVEGAEAGDNLGVSVGGGFDINADGVDDGLAGAPFADSGALTLENAGETYVISPIKPYEVMGLVLIEIVGATRLEWSVPYQGATHNVYRGQLGTAVAAGEVRTSAMVALACGLVNDADADGLPDYDDTVGPPPAGDAWFWLATARNAQGEGPLGPAGSSPPRINDAPCP